MPLLAARLPRFPTARLESSTCRWGGCLILLTVCSANDGLFPNTFAWLAAGPDSLPQTDCVPVDRVAFDYAC
jgi:hypothetical protein